ncbi:MAG: hypothetical protein VYD87_16650 [Pseudomonadota bacterium]|nr:hypothetical protein [Pseudomonadota bacterium]MEE3099121.1 hypothetical protein [Pseudomonadota bacterium]
MWLWLFAVAAPALLAVLAFWGVTVQAMVRRLERDHRDAYLELAARSPRLPVRMAASRELQRALGRGEPPPGSAAADPDLARLTARERTLRLALVILTPLTAFAFILL